MHLGQEHVVARITKMRYPTFILAKVTNRCPDIDSRDPLPNEAHRGLRIKVEAAHGAAPGHDLIQGFHRIDPKTKQ